MKLLITGHLGLIGSAIVKRHLEAGDTIYGFDIRYKDIPGVQPIYKSQLKHICQSVDVVSLQASHVSMIASQTQISRYINNNVGHVADVLQAMYDGNSKAKILLASSMGFYEHCNDKQTEQHSVKAHSYYGLTKFFQEEAVRLYSELYGNTAIALRYYSVMGNALDINNKNTGVINFMVRQLLEEGKITIQDDGNQTRDLIHADDVAEAHFLATRSSLEGFQAFNIASGQSYTLNEIANRIIDVMKPGAKIEHTGTKRAGDIYHSAADVSKAKELLGFEAKIDLDTMIKEYIMGQYTEKLNKRLADKQFDKKERKLKALKTKYNFSPKMEEMYFYVRDRYLELDNDAKVRYIDNYKNLPQKDLEVELIMERLLEEIND